MKRFKLKTGSISLHIGMHFKATIAGANAEGGIKKMEKALAALRPSPHGAKQERGNEPIDWKAHGERYDALMKQWAYNTRLLTLSISIVTLALAIYIAFAKDHSTQQSTQEPKILVLRSEPGYVQDTALIIDTVKHPLK